MVHRNLKTITTGLSTVALALAGAVPGSAAGRINPGSGNDCTALDAVFDDLESRKAQGEFTPGVMAAISECLVRGAINDESTKGGLRVALQSLSQRGLASRDELKPVVDLIGNTRNQPAHAPPLRFSRRTP